MKKLFASFLMISATLVSAEELHTFSNGEVADAEKINENFRTLEEEFGLLSSAIPIGIGAVFDEEGYAVVSVDCTSNPSAFADAARENQRVSKVHFKVSGSCSGFINLTDQVVIISGKGTDGFCSAPTEVRGLRVRQAVARIGCANVEFFQISDGAVAEAFDVSVGGLFIINGVLRFYMQERPLLTMGDPLVVGHSTLDIRPQGQFEELPSLQIPGRIDVADFSTVSIGGAVNFLDPTEVWAYRSSSFRCAACTGEISDFYLDRDSWATLGVGPQNLEVQQLRLGPGTTLNYSDTVNIGTVTKLENTSSSTPNSISNELSGCSATQDGSSVVINCADGTSGVLASEGTVVVYPEVATGQPVDYDVLPSGDTVVVDANGTVLGVARGVDNGRYDMSVTREGDGYGGELGIWNDEQTLTVGYGGASYSKIYYRDEECATEPFASTRTSNYIWDFVVIDIDQVLYATNAWINQSALFKSYRVNGYDGSSSYSPTSDCVAKEEIRIGFNTLSPLTLPDDIVSAVYPVSLDQIP